MATATVSAGLDGHRMEEKKLEYFSSINSMARKIMQEREKIKAKHGSSWEKMTPQEQDSAIDNCMMDPHIRARYAMHRVERDEVVCYPKLLIQTGQKIVHFGEEDITWQDEHSAPFSWETKSQLDFSLAPGSDQGISISQTEAKPAKASHSNHHGTKVPVSEGRKPEEESSFWKISAERSRLEGEKADFHSLTPSQIKSIEKGEKPLPSYLRQEPPVVSKEPEVPESLPPAPTKPAKQRAPKPPAPTPPAPIPVSIPVAVSTAPSSISISSNPLPPVSMSSSVAGWERSQSTLPSVSNTVDEMFSSSRMSKPPNIPAVMAKEREEEASPNPDASPTFSQFNTSSSILKTGFDFLDNW
ncbi:hypothetical protein JOB18_022346 [Solea senegalensis]|uniref:DUF4706 domain-containing protein n=1 Tax=Solea senegalensis TaxID=28829 RepID=A0AAV6RX54_SOLSE|nr:uncharacterized protein C1orf198 homolog [Solea senegalensis]KAG7508727.1 hypothetical protein JOB18_022346 [Solea senegalensis]